MKAAISVGAARHSLLADIRTCLADGANLQANVNRGIVFDEIVELEPGSESNSREAQILQWIHTPDRPVAGSLVHPVETGQQALRTAVMPSSSGDDSGEVQLVAVYMDHYSLFENQPSIESQDAGELPKYSSKYRLRQLDSDGSGSWADWGSTPAGGFIQNVSRHIAEHEIRREDASRDPLRANLVSLTSEQFACGLLAYLRASELVTARKVSFRRLIGTLGDVVATRSRGQSRRDEHPCDWVERLAAPADDKRTELENLVDLANARSHQALFGVLSNPIRSDRSSSSSEVVRGAPLADVDPVRDAVHGDFVRTSVESGWARPITNAFQSVGLAGGDSESLLGLVCRDAPTGSDFVTSFDQELDRVVSACVGGQSEVLDARERLRLLAWYHDYLCRLFGLGHGVYAYRFWLGRYVKAWTYLNNADDFTELDQDLDARLGELILPKLRDGSGSLISGSGRYLTVLTPRTESVQELGAKSQIVARINEGLRVTGRTRGDFIELRIADHHRDGPHTETRINLDFPLLCEALVCEDGLRGLTARTNAESPRVERFRAAVLSGLRGRPNAIKVVTMSENGLRESSLL
jgi:hypothetical protein